MWGRYGGQAATSRRPARLTRLRQRYRCTPRRGASHTFTEELPRLTPVAGPLTCQHCDRPFTSRDAPAGPRKHSFSLADIAHALFLVGSGWSYRAASERARTDAHIHRRGSGSPAVPNRDWGLTADWVELCSPVLMATLLPKSWPTQAVVLDTLPLHAAGAVNAAGFPARSGGGAVWSVLMAGGYEADVFKIYRLRAVPASPTARDWADFLTALPGRPRRVLSDDDSTILAGVRIAWPGMQHMIGWDKLLRRLATSDDSALRRDRRHSINDPLWIGAMDVLQNRRGWLNFVRLVRMEPRPGPVETLAWIKRHSPRIRRQFAMVPKWPSDTGPLEQKGAELRGMLVNRKYSFRNQERTNRLLDLITLHLNGADKERTYIRLLHEHVHKTHGLLPPHNRINTAARLH